MSNNNPRYRRHAILGRRNLWNKFRAFLRTQVTKFTATATGSAITATVASNGLTCAAHARKAGDGPFRFTAPTGTLSAVSTTTDYYVATVIDANTFTVSNNRDLLLPILVVAAGAGTATLTRQLTEQAMLDAINRRGLQTVKNATDIDAV